MFLLGIKNENAIFGQQGRDQWMTDLELYFNFFLYNEYMLKGKSLYFFK